MAKWAVRGGHTEKATGANGLINELTEDRKIKDAVIKYLKLSGETVLDCTPPANANLNAKTDLAYGVNTANSQKCDLFVSIHFNKAYSSYNGTIGSEVCVYRNHDYAQRVVNKLASLGFKNRGQKIRPELYELKNTSMTAMIVEVCFVEATGDVDLYKRLGSDAVGRAIAEGIANKSVPAPQPSTSTSTGNRLYRVIAGSYSVKENAQNQVNALKAKGFDAFIEAVDR